MAPTLEAPNRCAFQEQFFQLSWIYFYLNRCMYYKVKRIFNEFLGHICVDTIIMLSDE